MTLYRSTGVVLRTMRLGEADRIVTFATPEHGKVRAVAKGIRKTTSKVGGRLEPPAHVAIQCWRGRGELQTVTQVETIDAFRRLREDLGRLTIALSMAEAVDQILLEDHPAPAEVRALAGALGWLDDPANPTACVLGSFLWRLLAIEGAGPVLERCAACNAGDPQHDLVAFDALEGGMVCRSCRRSALRPAVTVSAGALTLMRRVLGGDLRGALVEADPAAAESERLAVGAFEAHVERRLRSLGAGRIGA